MYQRTDFNDLPPDLAVALRQTDYIVRSYLAGLSFLVHDTSRDPSFLGNHLLSYLAQDVLQSALSVVVLATEGMLSVATRAALPPRSIDQDLLCPAGQLWFECGRQARRVRQSALSQRISIKENLDLDMLPDGLRTAFTEEVGRLYGLTSVYVHLTRRRSSAASKRPRKASLRVKSARPSKR
jgi:hypothetical protein